MYITQDYHKVDAGDAVRFQVYWKDQVNQRSNLELKLNIPSAVDFQNISCNILSSFKKINDGGSILQSEMIVEGNLTCILLVVFKDNIIPSTKQKVSVSVTYSNISGTLCPVTVKNESIVQVVPILVLVTSTKNTSNLSADDLFNVTVSLKIPQCNCYLNISITMEPEKFEWVK